MNFTLGFGLMNATLRIAMDCGALNLWFEPDPSGVGIAWHGRPAWDFIDMRSQMGLEYEVITDLPEPENNLYSDMLALMKGVADISIDYWGVNYERSKLVDFSYPAYYTGIYIFSGKTTGFLHADLVMGVFDYRSYGFIFCALAGMIFVSWIYQFKEGKKNCFSTSCIYMFGNVLNQPLDNSIRPKALTGQIFMMVFSLYNYALCLMYNSIIISLIISGSKPPEINSFEDLNKTENRHLRIFLEEKSYIPSLLKSANMLDGFENRIEYTDTYSNPDTKRDIIEKVKRGTHVRIETKDNNRARLCQMNRKANQTIANLEDFMQSRYEWKINILS